jgi:hypothetical protein
MLDREQDNQSDQGLEEKKPWDGIRRDGHNEEGGDSFLFLTIRQVKKFGVDELLR